MATSVHSIASECAPSSRNPPRNVLEPEDVDVIITETSNRNIAVHGPLVDVIADLKKNPNNVAICTEAVKIANALPTIGQAESQEEIERGTPRSAIPHGKRSYDGHLK